mgnify:CR=1 FL=1
MARKLAPLACIAAAVVTAMSPHLALADENLTDKAVRDAIEAGVKFIYDKQEKWGHWESKAQKPKDHKASHGANGQWGGTTSLATYALLSAGEEWQDNEKLTKPLAFLAQTSTYGTYAVGIRAHVWPKLPDESAEINFFDQLREDSNLLVSGHNGKGGYRYVLGENNYDNSCTQYGVLGVWEVAKRGVPVNPKYWQLVEEHFMNVQSPDGGWGYKGGANSTMPMSAAGLAVLYITLDYLHTDDFRRSGVTPNHPVYKRINRGLEYFDKNFKPTTNGYLAVGIERVGLASGRKFFNGQDWYRSIAARMVKSQKENGSIGGGGGGVVQTAFSLVFLSRGRVPVFANKLEIPDEDWNNRPRDLAHLTKWASDQFEQDMNWQVISVERDATDWLDAPILYIASHKPLNLTDKQWRKLKRFVDLGGLIVTTADDSSRAFTRSVQEGFEKLYPYKFQQIEDDDYLADIVYPLDRLRVQTLHNGVRHLVLHIPYDVSGRFQVDDRNRDDDWKLMANAFQYAIGKSGSPRPRLEAHFEQKRGRASRTLQVAQVQHDGNWNPEPAAWSRLDIFSTNNASLGVNSYPVPLAELAGSDRPLAHIAGVGRTEFSDADADALRKYALNGGTAVIEAVGGDSDFAGSVRGLLSEAFPDSRLSLLNAGHPIITGEGLEGAFDNSTIDYRRFLKQRLAGGLMGRPQLMAIELEGRAAVVVPSEDLSMGMSGVNSWGIFGYDIESARRIMTNIALYARSSAASDEADPAPAEEGDAAEAPAKEPAVRVGALD